MPSTFDGPNLLITLPAPTDGVLNLSFADLYEEWLVWLNTGYGNRGYPPVFTEDFGGNALTTGILAGAYFVFNNNLGWRIKPDESDHTIYAVGNFPPADDSLPIAIKTVGGYTVFLAGLQPVTQNVDQILEKVEFAGRVIIDVANGVSGTGFRVGTPGTPSNNEADAYTIAIREGFTEYRIRGAITLGRDYAGWTFTAGSSILNDVVTFGGYAIPDCKFERIQVTGTAGAGAKQQFINCLLESCVGIDGLLIECGVSTSIACGGAGSMILASKTTLMSSPTYIDLVGDYRYVVGHFDAGYGVYLNAATNCAIQITQALGEIHIDSSCTGGALAIGGGICEITDNGAMTRVRDASFGVRLLEYTLKASKALKTGEFMALKDS